MFRLVITFGYCSPKHLGLVGAPGGVTRFKCKAVWRSLL